MNTIALPRTVRDLVEEYDAKLADLSDACARYESAKRAMEAAVTVFGKYTGSAFYGTGSLNSTQTLATMLRQSAWKAAFDMLQIDRLASATDRRLFERTVSEPPDFTPENLIATFGDYLLRPRFHILRGLAECFTALDPAYRSHSKVRIGVSALPKRIILTSVASYGSYGRDRLRDVMNALAIYRGQPLVEEAEFRALDDLHSVFRSKSGEVHFDGRPVQRYERGEYVEWTPPDRGVWLRKFQNGNGHLFFTPETLRDINMALAEFYGEVLPDAEDEEQPKKAPGTAVAKELQYYPTPPKVIDAVLYDVGIYKPEEMSWRAREEAPVRRVLEPSCGDGRILDAVRERGHQVFGIECHEGRAAEARAKGHPVLTANFLEAPPRPEFDFVVMNPPFYGQHYHKHVRHALRFLKPAGRLVAILPATAWYEHGLLADLKGTWTDLPAGSFAESGTNVPTGYLIVSAQVREAPL